MAERRDEEFREFVAGSQRRLLYAADLLTGDRGRAEDLVQQALLKTYLAWGRVRSGTAEAYARAVIVNGHTDWWRRRFWRERSVEHPPDRPVPGDVADALARREAVLRALSRLTRRERAVVVLRYYLDLTEAQTACELSCPVGTVKSAAARALAKLRTDPELRAEVTS